MRFRSSPRTHYAGRESPSVPTLSGGQASSDNGRIDHAQDRRTPWTLAQNFENYGVWYDTLGIASELAENPKDKKALADYEALLEKLERK